MPNVTIHVVKKFKLQLDPKQIGTKQEKTKDDEGREIERTVPVYAQEGDRVDFEPGFHEVPEHVANHWYVQYHLEGFVDPMPRPEMPDYAQKMLLAGKAARNNTSVDAAAPPPAASTGSVPASHYFAGTKQEDRTAPQHPSWMGRTS